MRALHVEYAGTAIRVHVEVTALVEDRVIGQLALAVRGFNASITQHAGRVVDHAARRLRPTDHGHGALRGSCDPLHRRLAIAQEAGAQQQVFRRIAADRQFGEQHQVRAVLVTRLGDHRGNALGVLRHGTHGEIELGQGDA